MALSNVEVLAVLAELVNEDTGLSTEFVTPEMSLGDDLAQIALDGIVALVQDRFGISVSDDAANGFATIGDVVTFVVANQPAQG